MGELYKQYHKMCHTPTMQTGVYKDKYDPDCPNQQISWTGAWKKADQIKMEDIEHVSSIASVHDSCMHML